jgi:hypothetical protein
MRLLQDRSLSRQEITMADYYDVVRVHADLSSAPRIILLFSAFQKDMSARGTG